MKKSSILLAVAHLPLVILLTLVAFFGNTWVTVIAGLFVGVTVYVFHEQKFSTRAIHELGATFLCVAGLLLFLFSDRGDAETTLFLYLPPTYFWGSYPIIRFFKWLKVRKRMRNRG